MHTKLAETNGMLVLDQNASNSAGFVINKRAILDDDTHEPDDRLESRRPARPRDQGYAFKTRSRRSNARA